VSLGVLNFVFSSEGLEELSDSVHGFSIKGLFGMGASNKEYEGNEEKL